MKNDDKVTLTFGQLKKLINENNDLLNSFEIILKNIEEYTKLAREYSKLNEYDKNAQASKYIFKDSIKSIIYWSKELEEIYKQRINGL